MFGYIVMNKPEIKFKDFDLYRSFYCGLCRELKSKYGISGQISLTYDMTFVVILLSALHEPHTQKGSTRCIIHPVCKQPVRRNTVTEYAADMQARCGGKRVLAAYPAAADTAHRSQSAGDRPGYRPGEPAAPAPDAHRIPSR